jgi:hypothetical protein
MGAALTTFHQGVIVRSLKRIVGALALVACAVSASSVSAQTLQVLTAGSSAQFGPFAVAAYKLAKKGGVAAHHYTVKSGTCTSGSTTCYASLFDSRTVGSATINKEPGNLWVVWSTNGIWAYLSVDSVVGVRNFMAAPRATLSLAASASLPLSATSNYLYWNDKTNDTAHTSTVYAALNGMALTAANTDIRPEDALFATNRALNTLGYGSVADPRSGHSGQYLIGYGIQSKFASGVANPVSFAISGSDPFTGTTVTPFVTIPIGAAPIVFLANNSSGAATASATNITTANAALLWGGAGGCAGSLVTGVSSGAAINPILREPLSGTMNTTEFSVFQPGGDSQETGVNNGNLPAPNGNINPLQLPCGSGARYRAIGTGDEVKDVETVTNSMGYAFFSYESTGANATLKYITLNGIDPIQETYSTGALPSCGSGAGYLSCPLPGGTSFPHLRDGSYPAWSIYRLVTDSAGEAHAQTLISEAQTLVNSTIPDFVPFNPACAVVKSGKNDPGLAVYREHYVPSTIETTPDTISITPDDGPRNTKNVACTVVRASLPHLTLGGAGATNSEAGGDVGGGIEGPFKSTHLPTVPGPTQSSTH